MKTAIVIGVAGLLAAGCDAPSGFGLVTEDLEGGSLLSAWSDGDHMLAVGGQLDGSGGLLLSDAEGCWSEATIDPVGRPVWWIHGADAGRWFAVGDQGLVLRGDASEVIDESVPTDSTLYGVWDDGEHVWAVGGDVFGSGLGEIWRRSGDRWELFASDLPGVVFKVWNGWFVGDGVAYVLEDGQLVDRTPPGQPRLLTVRGRGPDDVWAVGGRSGPELWRWDGDAWSTLEVSPLCASLPLSGVWTAPGDDVWIAGMQGGMGRWDGESWECPEQPVTYDDLHAVWRHGDELLWFGGNLSSRSANHGTIARYTSGSAAPSKAACD